MKLEFASVTFVVLVHDTSDRTLFESDHIKELAESSNIERTMSVPLSK